MLHVIEDLAGDWRRLDERIETLSREIETIARQDAGCERLMRVPGIGPIISSAIVAAIGSGDVFSKGRDFAAWLGLVPKQISTGDRTILGKISKRGNRYLRVLFVQAAWVVLVKPMSWERHGLKSWIEAAKKRLHHNVLEQDDESRRGSETTIWSTANEYRYGGYEAGYGYKSVGLPSLFDPSVEQILVETGVRLAERLFPEAEPWDSAAGWLARGEVPRLPDTPLEHPSRVASEATP